LPEVYGLAVILVICVIERQHLHAPWMNQWECVGSMCMGSAMGGGVEVSLLR